MQNAKSWLFLQHSVTCTGDTLCDAVSSDEFMKGATLFSTSDAT